MGYSVSMYIINVSRDKMNSFFLRLILLGYILKVYYQFMKNNIELLVKVYQLRPPVDEVGVSTWVQEISQVG